jgi:hypothetical protein
MSANEPAAGQLKLIWHKSSYSGAEGGQCVEAAITDLAVHIRDSKDPSGPWLKVDPAAWSSFLRFAATRDS